jgi:cold shock CspA family protein
MDASGDQSDKTNSKVETATSEADEKTLQRNRSAQLVDKDDPKKVVVRGVLGKVKWFSVIRGYGFINRSDTDEDVFVHVSSIIHDGPQRYALDPDMEVLFDVTTGKSSQD